MSFVIISILLISITKCFAGFTNFSYKLDCYQSVVTNNTPELYRSSLELSLTTDEQNIITVNYTKEDIYLFGIPKCVTYYAHNDTHSVTWQGVISVKQLPIECYIRKNEYCFDSVNNLIFSNITGGITCCCSTNNCNYGSPAFYVILRTVRSPRWIDNFFKEIISPWLRLISLASVLIGFCILATIAEFYLIRVCDKFCLLNLPNIRNPIIKQILLDNTNRKKIVRKCKIRKLPREKNAITVREMTAMDSCDKLEVKKSIDVQTTQFSCKTAKTNYSLTPTVKSNRTENKRKRSTSKLNSCVTQKESEIYRNETKLKRMPSATTLTKKKRKQIPSLTFKQLELMEDQRKMENEMEEKKMKNDETEGPKEVKTTQEENMWEQKGKEEGSHRL